jgi:GAF domain-containing protein
VGILGLKLARSGLHSTPEQRRLMEAFASQTALAIERAQSAAALSGRTADALESRTASKGNRSDDGMAH